MWWVVVAQAQEPAPWDRVGWRFAGLPAINYNTDEGLGLGVVGSAFRYDGGTRPYKTSLTAAVFATTRGVQSHSIEVDTLNVAGSPLRLSGRVELQTTLTSNYCGVGPEVTCDPAVAEAAAAGLEGEARDELVRHYYHRRFINPIGTLNVRWQLDPMPHRVEVFGGWRGSWLLPGDFSDPTPYPGSLYAQDHPDGERGVTSTLQLGIMLDDRDHEAAPTRGYWVEASVRGAHHLYGSDFDFVGADVTLRGYLPLGTPRLVLANRVVLDALTGDVPTLELARAGGSQRFFGMRGVRAHRYIGEVKVLEQAELRWTFTDFGVGSSEVKLGVLGFLDLGFVAEDLDAAGSMFATPLPSAGGGLRVTLDENFIVRADVGASPLEGGSPGIYIDLRNLF